jgi:hypothetical protein
MVWNGWKPAGTMDWKPPLASGSPIPPIPSLPEVWMTWKPPLPPRAVPKVPAPGGWRLKHDGAKQGLEGSYYSYYSYWLVVWNICFPCIGNSNPNWLIFFGGVAQPPTSFCWRPKLKDTRRTDEWLGVTICSRESWRNANQLGCLRILRETHSMPWFIKVHHLLHRMTRNSCGHVLRTSNVFQMKKQMLS